MSRTVSKIAQAVFSYPVIPFLGRFLLSAVLIAVLAGVWQDLLSFVQAGPAFSLRIQAKAEEHKRSQLFYDTGSGFSEEGSVVLHMPGDRRFRDYLFPLPAKFIHGFRFDPATTSGGLAIKKADIVMEIVRHGQIAVKSIDLLTLKPGNQIRELTFKSGELTILPSEKADDPQVLIPVAFDALHRSRLIWESAQIVSMILVLGVPCLLLLRIWFRWEDKTWGVIAVVALIVFGLRCAALCESAMSPMLHITVQSSVYGEMQLYYDLGQGFSEDLSTKAIVYPDRNPQTYEWKIPNKPIRNLRLDPPASKNALVLDNISLTNGLDQPIKPFRIDLGMAFPNKDIAVFHLQESVITLQTEEDAPDPQVCIPFASPLRPEIASSAYLVRISLEFLIICCVTLGLIFYVTHANSAKRLRWLLLCAAAVIIFLRYPQILLAPRFLAEEGSLFFQRAYQWDTTALSSFFYTHEIVGYYNFIADFASWAAASFLSLPHAPYANLLLSFVFQSFPIYLIAASRSVLWNTPLRRAMGILLVLLVPLSADVWLTTIGTQYHLGLIAFLLLLESGERHSAFGTWLRRGMLLVGGLSGISSCLMTPLYFLKAWRNRQRETLLQALVLAFAVFVQLFSLLSSSNTRLSNPGDVVSLTANAVNANFVSTLFGPTVASLLSQILYGMIDGAFSELIGLLAAILVLEGIFLLFLFKRIHNPGLFFSVLGALGLAVTVAYIGMINGKWETVDPYNAPRYFWLPNVILALGVLFAIKEQPSWRATLQQNRLAVFCLLMIVTHGVLHYDMTGYGRTMPSWRKEATLWMQDRNKETIALWPRGWHLILERRD